MAEPKRTANAPEARELAERQTRRLRSIARQLKRRLGSLIDLRDLIGYGAQGMMEAAARFRPDGPQSFHRYMYYRVRGAMLDAARRTVAESAIIERDVDVEAFIEESQLLDDRVAERQLLVVLAIHVAALPDSQRRLVELHYFEGLSLADAAAVIGTSRSWACRLHARAIVQLREWLEGPK